MLFSDASGRKVVSTSSAATVGTVSGFLVDPQKRAVIGVQIKKSKSGDVLAWSSISAFGSDAVTVESEDKIIEIGSDEALSAMDGKEHRVLGKRILSTAGVDLGEVKDIEFDPESGTITSVVAEAGSIEGQKLIGIGSYAVILDHSER